MFAKHAIFQMCTIIDKEAVMIQNNVMKVFEKKTDKIFQCLIYAIFTYLLVSNEFISFKNIFFSPILCMFQE